MRVIPIAKALMILLIIANCHCAFFKNTQNRDGNLKKEIIKDVTTETTVVNILGMPASVSPNNIGDEVWNYKNLSYSTKKSDDGKTLTLWELSTGDSTEVSKHYNLLITFNQNDVVKDFELVLAPFDSK